jgi:hypothetical protein
MLQRVLDEILASDSIPPCGCARRSKLAYTAAVRGGRLAHREVAELKA